jgi:hypothetical protein
VAAAALASGCAFIPAGTGPQPASAPAPPPGAGSCCGLLVRGPQPTWGPEDVVRNFLLASAIRANHFRVARQYLTQSANRAWRPSTAVTILATEPQETLLQPHLSGPGTNPTVLVVGQEQAILNPAGQYIPAAGGQATDQPTEEFALQKVNGVYKIDQLIPPRHSKVRNELLLTSDLFRLEYTPRNLYYYGRGKTGLVPYPVFVPVQGKDPPVTLIDDLIHGPSGWLRGAAESAFPHRSHLLPPIQVFPGPSGVRTAVVNIAVPGHVQDGQESRMAAQLVATLTSPVYSPPLFRAVKIKFNGRPWQPSGQPGSALGLSASQRYIPHLPADAEAYYLAQGGVLRSLSSGSGRGAVVTRGPGAAQVSLTKVAVSPGGGRLAGLAGPANTIYTGVLVTGPGHRQSFEQLQAQLAGTSITSLSWDNSDNLWVVGTKGHQPGVRVLVSGQGPGLPVQLPVLHGPVTSLRVAPDGVRVAMIVGEGKSAHLVLSAVMRDHAGGFLLTKPAPLFPTLQGVSALTWYDEDHLLVITGSGEDSQYWEVPVDGYNPTSLMKLPGLSTVTAAGPGHPIYLGLENGQLERATGLHQSLVPITPGQAIIYPG